MPDADVVLEAKAEERREAALEQIADAYESRTTLRPERAGAQPGRRPLTPERLYLDAEEWSARLGARSVAHAFSPDKGDPTHAVPRFAMSADPRRAFAGYVRDAIAAGRRVVLAGAADADRRRLTRQAEKAADRPPEPASDWDAVRKAPPGSLLALAIDLDAGFVDAEEDVAVIAAADLLGSRAKTVDQAPARPLLPTGDIEFRLGDAVIHLDHGMGVLRGLETVTAGETAQDTLRLDYANDAKLLMPADEIERVWRYASEAETVTLDRLDGGSWPKRQAQVAAAVAESARHLVELARAREATTAPKLAPPRQAFERFVARFPFRRRRTKRAPSPMLSPTSPPAVRWTGWCAAMSGSARPRWLCAAAAAGARRQAGGRRWRPTTVLARQHLQTFSRRFAGLGIEVAGLSRLVKPAEAKARQGRARGRDDPGRDRHPCGRGEGRALRGSRSRGHRRGAALRRAPQADAARPRATALHVLTLTATPIPRTLQAALVGLQDLSVIATPPARRRPIRTFLTPFDSATVREALVRERRRGGQSFVVVPADRGHRADGEASARAGAPNSSSWSRMATCRPRTSTTRWWRFAERRRRRAARHQHHRERPRRAPRQHHAGLARRPLRPVAASPAARARRPRARRAASPTS